MLSLFTLIALASPLDGVYAAPWPQLGPVVQIHDGQLQVHSTERLDLGLSMPLTITPRRLFFDHARHPDQVGASWAHPDRLSTPAPPSTGTTWAVIDGVLWTNVLLEIRPGHWRSEASAFDDAPPSIDWTPAASRLVFGGAAPRVATAVRMSWDPRTGGGLLLPIHGRPAAARGPAWRRMDACRGGPAVLCKSGVYDAHHIEQWARWLDAPAHRRYAWRRTPHALLSPWSVPWGPVGRVPQPQLSAEGHWRGAGPEAVSLTVRGREAPSPFGALALAPSRPQVVVHQPDAAGISRLRFDDVDCMMSHDDWPGYLLWFMVDADHLMLFQGSSSHTEVPGGGFMLTRARASARKEVKRGLQPD